MKEVTTHEDQEAHCRRSIGSNEALLGQSTMLGMLGPDGIEGYRSDPHPSVEPTLVSALTGPSSRLGAEFMRLADWLQPVGVDCRVFLVSDEAFELEGLKAPPEALLQALTQLRMGCTRSEVERLIGTQASQELLDNLEAVGWLRYEPLPGAGEIWERQAGLLDDLGDARAAAANLQDSHVWILGAGGVGSVLADLLARAGVGQFTVIDHDHRRGT